MTKSIETTELRRLRSTNSEMLLLDVLPKDKFDKDHIERAINAPLESNDFLGTVAKAAGRKDKKIVVYCSDAGCNASSKAASKLTAAGYGDVTTYEGGLGAWRNEPADAGDAGANPQKGSARTDGSTNRSADKPGQARSSPYGGTKQGPAAQPAKPDTKS